MLTWFSVLAGSVSTDQHKKERRQTGPTAERIMIRLRETKLGRLGYVKRNFETNGMYKCL